MRLFNTLTGTIDPVGAPDGTLRMYVCGVTPYDTTHLGHALTYATFDVIHRYFRYRGVKVRYIQNITDIDDDILRKSAEVGEPWDELGRRWAQVHIRSLEDLNVLAPEEYTRATEHIPMMIEIIERLVAGGQAYQAGPNVYFRTRSFQHYGELSKLPDEVMRARLDETGDSTTDVHKEAPLDFVLWLGQRIGEPAWQSPWGAGRPGWHIECSAMAIQHLGPTLDIHGGGADLVYPHHENEIAQSESFSGQRPFTRTWVHNGMLRLGTEKMSKSRGNLILAQELRGRYSADAIRLYLHGERYRDSFAFDESKLKAAQELAHRLTWAAHLPDGNGESVDPSRYRDEFLHAIEDDLDTPTGIRVLGDLAQVIRAGRQQHRGIADAQRELRTLGDIVGLRLPTPTEER